MDMKPVQKTTEYKLSANQLIDMIARELKKFFQQRWPVTGEHCSTCKCRRNDVEIDCPNCDGTGYDPTDEKPFAQCHECYGDGDGPGRVKVVTLRMVPDRITAEWLGS